jgi:hypothetical protein
LKETFPKKPQHFWICMRQIAQNPPATNLTFASRAVSASHEPLLCLPRCLRRPLTSPLASRPASPKASAAPFAFLNAPAGAIRLPPARQPPIPAPSRPLPRTRPCCLWADARQI